MRLLPLPIIIAAAFAVFSPTFITSMHGDEWKAIWLARQALVVKGNYLPINAWDLPYTFEHITLDLMTKIFDIYSGWFYFASFTIRMVVAIAIYKLVYQLTSLKTSAYVSSFIFAITSVGVESVIWVRNYSAYFSLLIFIFVYKKYIYKKNFNPLVIALSFVAILIVNTTRSHGFLILYFLLTVPYVLDIKRIKPVLITWLLMAVTFTITASSPLFGNQAGNFIPDNFSLSMFLVSTLGNFGRIFIAGPTYMRIMFASIGALFLFWKSEYLKHKYPRLIWIVFLIGYISVYFYSGTVLTEHYQSGLFGSYFSVVLASSVVYEYFSKNTSFKSTLLITAFSLSFLIIPMIRQPQVRMGSDHRYLIHSATVIPLICGLALKRHFKLSMIAICTVVYILSSQTFKLLEIHKNAHSSEYTEKVWRELSQKLDKSQLSDTNTEFLFLAEDPDMFSKVNASVYFDFAYHAGIVFEVWDESALPLDSWMFSKPEQRQDFLDNRSGEKNYILLDFLVE